VTSDKFEWDTLEDLICQRRRGKEEKEEDYISDSMANKSQCFPTDL
jgi:hypothetical protein